MSGEWKKPTLLRYAKVYEVLRNDPLLKKKLGHETVKVGGPSQRFVEMPAEVIPVTEAIHKQGHDAYTCDKPTILRLSHQFFFPKSTKSVKPMASKSLLDEIVARETSLNAQIATLQKQMDALVLERDECVAAAQAIKARRGLSTEAKTAPYECMACGGVPFAKRGTYLRHILRQHCVYTQHGPLVVDVLPEEWELLLKERSTTGEQQQSVDELRKRVKVTQAVREALAISLQEPLLRSHTSKAHTLVLKQQEGADSAQAQQTTQAGGDPEPEPEPEDEAPIPLRPRPGTAAPESTQTPGQKKPLKRSEQVRLFNDFALACFKSLTPEQAKAGVEVTVFMETFNKHYGKSLDCVITRSACHNRLLSLAEKGKFVFTGGRVYPLSVKSEVQENQ